jgi:hypothetical protein
MAAAVLVTGPGCRATRPRHQEGTAEHGQKQTAANQNQVRLRMRALVDPMCGQIEQVADAIMSGTTNRATQRAALHWKTEGVPAMREALFQPDPLTAVLDAWVLCYQMADYFEKGKGRELLGEASPQAAAACRQMEEELARIAATGTATGDASKPRALARRWASEHPIRHSIAGRESTLSRVLEQEIADSFSVGEAVAEITTTVDDLNRRLEVYSDQLFRQARWEAELFKLELFDDLSADRVVPIIERAVKSAEQATVIAERLAPAFERAVSVTLEVPKLAATEREAATKFLQDEFARTLEFAQTERIAALAHLTTERIEALKELRKDLAEEQAALTRDALEVSLQVMDHALWKVAQIMAATVLMLLVATVAILFLVRRMFFRTPGPPEN